MTSLMPRQTVSSGCSCAGAASRTASARTRVSSWSGKIASSLERKWRKKVRRATPAARRDLVDRRRLVALGREQLHRRGRQFAAHLEPLGGGARACGTLRGVGRRRCTGGLGGLGHGGNVLHARACGSGQPAPSTGADRRRVEQPAPAGPAPDRGRPAAADRRPQRRAYSRKPRPVLRPRQPAATRCSSSGAGARPGSRNSLCSTFSMASETSSPTTSRSSNGPIG